MATTDQEPTAASPAVKWLVGERQMPRSCREVARHALAAGEAHPLASNAAFPSLEQVNSAVAALRSTPSALNDSFSSRKSGGDVSPELVVLQYGDADPLGVLVSSTADRPESGHASTLIDCMQTSEASDESTLTSITIKRKWKEHTDRLLAEYADHTFKIKASMLEVNELENDISFVPKSDYHKQDDSTEVSVIMKTRARLEQLERGPNKTLPSLT